MQSTDKESGAFFWKNGPIGLNAMSPDNDTSASPGDAGLLSTLTLNLRFGLADDGANNWAYRKKALPALFRKYRPDFIAFQEANDFQIDYLAEILMEYEFLGKRSPAPPNWQNNVIFYRNHWDPQVYKHLFLSRTPSIPSKFTDSRWPRQCTIGMFASGERKLICVDTHFDFASHVQTQSAELIMRQLDKLPASLPVVLMGDFNATPQDPCYRVFTGRRKGSPPEAPPFKNAAPMPFPGTYHGFKGGPDGDHIDWILYRGPIVPVDYHVEMEPFRGFYPSDHFPVHAAFDWVDEKSQNIEFVTHR
jgi:endonuclease/exonuclease/phosphatase family metal-dependent hydrolase